MEHDTRSMQVCPGSMLLAGQAQCHNKTWQIQVPHQIWSIDQLGTPDARRALCCQTKNNFAGVLVQILANRTDSILKCLLFNNCNFSELFSNNSVSAGKSPCCHVTYQLQSSIWLVQIRWEPINNWQTCSTQRWPLYVHSSLVPSYTQLNSKKWF